MKTYIITSCTDFGNCIDIVNANSKLEAVYLWERADIDNFDKEIVEIDILDTHHKEVVFSLVTNL